MKYKGLYNFCRLYLSNDFLVKTRKVDLLQKFSLPKKYFVLIFLLLGAAVPSFSNTILPKATLTNPSLPPFFVAGANVNIVVSTAVTSGGTWSGAGTIGDPRTFIPTNGTLTANINRTELGTAISTYPYVQLSTTIAGTSSGTGTVIFQDTVYSRSASTATRKFTINANSTITIAKELKLTTDFLTNNQNFTPVAIELNSTTGNILVQDSITTSPTFTYLTYVQRGAKGGDITINANAGTISITGVLHTLGQLNRSTNNQVLAAGNGADAYGGDGGNIVLNGSTGISISGQINSGANQSGNNTLAGAIPGSLTVNTSATSITSNGVNDGQTGTAQFNIGSFTKLGTGVFALKSSTWGGYVTDGYSNNNPVFTISGGTLSLTGTSSIYKNGELDLSAGTTLDLNGNSVTISTLTGASTSIIKGTGIITLIYNNPNKLLTSFDGQITGAVSLIKSSNAEVAHGVLVLSNLGNASDYTGTTTINLGSIRINKASALGASGSSNNTIIKNGGSLQVLGAISVPEPISIRGIGDNNLTNGNTDPASLNYIGAIFDSTGNNSFTGTITLDSAATISTLLTTSSASHTLTLTTISLSGYELTINNNKSAVNVSGIISGTGGMLTKIGTDTLTLSGVNTFTGRTKISKGTLKIGIANAINSASDIYFDGGNLSTGGFSDLVGNAYVTNSGSNLILGTGVHTFQFSGSDNSFASNTLLIKGWAGTYATPGSTGTGAKLQFTNKQLSTQIDRFKFYNYGTSATHNAIQINASTPFELVPGNVPTVSGFSNLNISTAASSGGAWTGDGSSGAPFTFTISAENANVNINEVLTKVVASNGNVSLNTTYAAGTQNGAVFFSSAGTATTTSSNANTFQVTASNSIVVNQPFSLSTDGTSTSALVPSISLTADSIYINAAVKLNAAANSFSGGTAAKGGNITLTANSIVSIASTGSIESKGANNTATGATSLGGNGGLVSITGPNGISILGNINTSNGYSSASASTLNLSRPGKLIVSTNNSTISSSGYNDGQTTNTLTIGDLDKNGTGSFKVTSSVWGGSASGTTSSTTPIITVNTGSLKLGSSTSISDVANVVVASGASFDLNGNNETISTISGAGTITSTSSANTLTLLSANTDVTSSTFSGTLGSVSITKNGTGTLLLSSDNSTTYSGLTTIGQGVLQISNAGALGTAASTTSVSSTGTLQLVGNNLTVVEPITINGDGYNSIGAISNLTGSNTWSGTITLGSSSKISTGTSTGTTTDVLTISGGINAASYTLTAEAIKAMKIDGVISGTGGLTKTGNDTLALTAANTYTGVTTVSTGAISVRNAAALGGSTTAQNTIVSAGAAVNIVGDGFTIAEPFTLNGTGISSNGAIWIPSTSGASTLTGLITTATASRINNDGASLLTISTGGITNTGGLSLGVKGAGNVSVSSAISGAGAITKDGTGTGKLILNASNSYAGTTTVSEGVLQIQNKDALGSTSPGTSASSTIVSNNAALEINGSLLIPEPITITGTGLTSTGAIRNILGTSSISGTISLTGNARINVDAGTLSMTNAAMTLGTYNLNAGVFTATNMSISSAITGSGTLTKDSLGSLYLSGTSSSYTGAISVYNGVLNVQNASALGATTGITTVNSGASIQIQNNISAAEPISIAGNGIASQGAIRSISGTNILSGTISLTADARINIDAGTLSMTSTGTALALDVNNLNIGVYTATSIYVTGAITGAGTLTKDSTGILYLSGNSATYAGVVNIYNGAINIQTQANVLGTSAGATNVYNGAALQIQSNLTTAEPVNIIGTGISGLGAIRNISGTNTFSGAISLNGAARINVDAGTLSTTGITMGSYALNTGVYSGTSMAVNGSMTSDAGSILTKDSTGTLILAGANTGLLGTINVYNGVLRTQHADALGAASASTNIISSGAALEIYGATALTIAEPFNINGTGVSSGGAIRLIGTSAAATLTGGLTAQTASRINTDATSGTSTLTISTTGISNTPGLTFGVTSAGSINITSAISGASASTSNIIKDGTGAGKLILSSANTYAGTTTVTAGTLQITNNDALGANTQATIVSNGATLELNGPTAVTEAFNLNGLGVSSSGALRILSGNPSATLSGLITAPTATKINTDIASGSNTITISGGITNTAGVTFGGVGDVAITNTISGTDVSNSNLNKDGAGRLTLSTTNTYAGTTSITAGIVQITNADALGSASSGGSGLSTTTIGNNAAVEINGATALTIPEVMTINGLGYSGANGAIRLLGSSAAATLSGAITVPTASRINTDNTTAANTLTFSGSITDNASLTFGTASDGGITVSSLLTGTGGIAKDGSGAGKLILTTANTYAGTTSITAGVIQIQNATALGALASAGTTITATGAALEIYGTSALSIPETFTINGTGLSSGGAIKLVGASSAATLTGAITVASASRINTDVTAGTNTLTISSAITNTGGLTFGITSAGAITVSGAIGGTDATNSYITKDGTGSGKLILSSANTFAGPASVSAGVVQIQNKDALGSATPGTGSSSTIVANGAALEISGASLSIPEGITINGTGLSSTGAIRNILGANILSGTVSLTADARINVDAGTLSMTNTSAAISLSGNALNVGVYTSTSMYISGPLTGTGSFTKDSTGSLYLSGNNSAYTGAISVFNGVMNVQNANALGAITGSTAVYTGAALQLQGGIAFAAEPISINGNGVSNDGALRNILGANTLAGAISLTGAARINVDAGTLSTTAIALGANNLNTGVYSGTSMYATGEITGSGILTKDSTGTLYVSGNSSTYSGAVNIYNGVLNLQNNNGLGTNAGNTTVYNNASLQVQNNITSPEPIIITGAGFGSLGAIRSISGANALTGNISLTNNARINIDAGTLSITTGTLALSTYALNTGVYSGTSMSITSLLTGDASSTLTKDSTGTLNLSGNNTGYAGAISVYNGILNAQSSNALGATSGTTTVRAGATVQVLGNSLNIPEPITINGDGVATNQGAIRNPSGNNSWSGLITLGADARIVTTGSASTDSLIIITGGINTGNFTLTADATKGMRIDGVVTGNGGITKIGNDTLAITGTNNYTGATIVNNGAISVRNIAAFGGTGGATTVNTGAAVYIVGAGFNIAEPFVLNSLGVSNANGAIWIPSSSGATTLSGLITTSAASRINNDGASLLTIGTAGITNTGGLTLGVNGTGGMTVTGIIAGTNASTSNLTKDGTGAGKLILTTANTYAGTTSITTGIVQITNQDALGSSSPGVTGYSTTTISNGAALEINGASSFTIPEVINTNGYGVSSTGAIRLISGAAAANLIGGITAQTDSRINTDVSVGTNTLTISTASVTNTGGLSFGIASNAGITISSAIAGAGGITRDGSGTGKLILATANSYTGTTTITSGIIQIQNGAALGNASANTVVAAGAALEINGATLSIAEPFALSGNGISNDGAIRNLTGTNSISGTITLNANARINVDAGSLSATSSTSLATNTFSLNAGVNTATSMGITGAITGSGTLTKDSLGTLVLSGTSTSYTGAITIYKGVVNIQSADALGGTGAGTTVYSGAALQVQTSSTTVFAAEPITISGTGISNDGVIRNITGTNTLAGPITLAAISRINSDAGTLAFSNTNSIALATYGLTMGGNGNNTVTGVLASTASSATATLTKEGSGTLILNGANTYTGATNITAGIVQVQNNDALGSQTAGTGSSNTIVSDGAVIQIYGTNLTIPEAISIYGTGISSGGAIRNFTGSGGTNILSNTITLNSNARINVDASTLTMNNATAAIALGGYTLNTGVNTATNFNISGLLTGSGAFTKDSLGTITLSGTNTGYTGPITVAKGVMNIQNASALGSTDVSTTVVAGAALQLQNNITVAEQNIYINGTGVASDGAIRNISGANALSGTVNLSTSARINVDAGTLSMTNATAAIAMGSSNINTGIAASTSMSVSGLITGTGNFTKDSTGTIYLSGANTGYSGAIGIYKGVMNIQNNDALGTTTTGTTVSTGAALQLQNGITVAEALININGGGFSTDGAIRSISGTNTISGNINLQSDARINVDANYLILNNGTSAVTNNAFALTFGGLGTDTLSGKITGSGTVTKDGTGTLVLNADNGTSYTGAATISAGLVNLMNNNSLGSTSGATSVTAGATVQIVSATSLTIPEPITINGDGIATNQGALRNPSGNNTWTGAITVGSAGARIVSGTLSGTTTDSLLITTGGINTGTASSTLILDVVKGVHIRGVISGAGALTKISADTLLLSGANSYSGSTSINEGLVQLLNQDGLGSTNPGPSRQHEGKRVYWIGAWHGIVNLQSQHRCRT